LAWVASLAFSGLPGGLCGVGGVFQYLPQHAIAFLVIRSHYNPVDALGI
jgi:hypothetical protein